MTHRTRTRFVLESLEGVVVSVVVLCSWPVSRRWLRHWGSRVEERERAWPGDRLVSPGHETHTRGITIEAPPDAIWPWIVQFGLGRAGFYSYELLERLSGIPVVNVESVESSLQSLAVGDEIRLHPTAPGIPVGDLRPGRHICFGERRHAAPADGSPGPGRSWSMYIEPVSADVSRLLLRSCVEPLREASWVKRLASALEAPIDFVMEQRMLRTVRRLAEAGRA